MKPIIKSRKKRALRSSCVLLYAVVYAAMFAAAFPAGRGGVWIDALLVWTVAGVDEIVGWNAMQYTVSDRKPVGRFATVASGVLAVGSITGLEMLSAYVSYQHGFGSFVQSIPLRIFCTTLAYTILAPRYGLGAAGDPTKCAHVVADAVAPSQVLSMLVTRSRALIEKNILKTRKLFLFSEFSHYFCAMKTGSVLYGA